MKNIILLLLVLHCSTHFLYSQNGRSESNKINSINTNEMIQGDYRYSPVYLLPENIDTSIRELKLVAFIDSVPLNFMSESEIWTKNNCPNCSYTGPVFDNDKSKRILIYLINLSDTAVKIVIQDATVKVIQEAKDSSGTWMPIEYWVNSSCFNSYSTRSIPSNHYISTTGYRYNDNFMTELRFKMKIDGYTVISNPFYGYINYSQFKKPENPGFKSFF